MTNKPTLREEFRLWWQAAPRVWVIIGAVILLAFVFRGTLDVIATIAFAVVFGFFVVSIIPALIGALAGKFIGHIIRKARCPDDMKRVRNVPLVFPRRPSAR